MKKRAKRKKSGISRLVLLVLPVFCLFLLNIAPVSAQKDQAQKSQPKGDSASPTTRSIEGTVLSSSGAPVPGAVVLIKDSKSLQVRSYIAQADGRYHFFGLSTDVNYSLRAEDKVMTSKTKNVSVFDSHRTVKLDLKLQKKIDRKS
jgi:hypothetical protein